MPYRRREFVDVFNDYVDAHTIYASSSESDVDDVSEDDDDSDAIGSADVQLLTCVTCIVLLTGAVVTTLFTCINIAVAC